MIETITMIVLMFGVIIAVGLISVWINDSLEALLKPQTQEAEGWVLHRAQTLTNTSPKPMYTVKHYQIPQPHKVPALTSTPIKAADVSQKIVRIDFSQKPPLDGSQLGEHVRVLPKAA